MKHRLVIGSRTASFVVVAGVAALLLLPGGCRALSDRGPLVVALDDIPATLDPHLHNESVVWSVLSNFYDGLVSMSPDMKLEPALATSWEQRSPTEWRLALREGVHFSNGDGFGPEDVVASFERARSHPRSGIRHHLLGVETVHADGPHGVVIVTPSPVPDLLNRLSFLYIVPRRHAAPAEITQPTGTGPYRFVGRVGDGSIDAASWRSWRGAMDISRVRFTFHDGSSEEALALLLAGGIDVLASVGDEDLGRVEGSPGLRLEPQPRLGVQLLAIASAAARGVAGTALADVRVRRAILLALNRPAWVGKLYRGNAAVASQYVNPVVFGYAPDLSPLPYDPAEARRLMAESGFLDEFEVTLGHGPGLPALVSAIREDLSRIGIRVRSFEAAFGDLVSMARTGEVPLFFYAWSCSTGDASDFLNSSVHSRDDTLGLGRENYTSFSDPEVDRLLGQAEAELDTARRLELLQQAQRRVLAALPVLPLTIRWGYVGVSDRVDIVTRHDKKLWVGAFRWRR